MDEHLDEAWQFISRAYEQLEAAQRDSDKDFSAMLSALGRVQKEIVAAQKSNKCGRCGCRLFKNICGHCGEEE